MTILRFVFESDVHRKDTEEKQVCSDCPMQTAQYDWMVVESDKLV